MWDFHLVRFVCSCTQSFAWVHRKCVYTKEIKDSLTVNKLVEIKLSCN